MRQAGEAEFRRLIRPSVLPPPVIPFRKQPQFLIREFRSITTGQQTFHDALAITVVAVARVVEDPASLDRGGCVGECFRYRRDACVSACGPEWYNPTVTLFLS